MKKLFAILLFLCGAGIVSAQLSAPTPLVNGEQMQISRSKINTSFTNYRTFINKLYDTTVSHNLRIKALDVRLSFIETAIAGGGIGGGTTYTIGSGLTLATGNEIRLGGTLYQSASFQLADNYFILASEASAPTNGNYYYSTQSMIGGLSLNASNYSSGVRTLTSYLDVKPDGSVNLFGSQLHGSGQLAGFSVNTSGQATLKSQTLSSTAQLVMSSNSAVMTVSPIMGQTQTYTFGGRYLTYSVDPTAYYTDLSLVTKSYVDKRPNTVELILTDTIKTTNLSTRVIFAAPAVLNGTNLVSMKVLVANSQGNRVPSVLATRTRGTTSVTIASGGNFTTDATINSAYQSIQTGDRFSFSWTLGAGTTAPDGIIVSLTFQTP